MEDQQIENRVNQSDALLYQYLCQDDRKEDCNYSSSISLGQTKIINETISLEEKRRSSILKEDLQDSRELTLNNNDTTYALNTQPEDRYTFNDEQLVKNFLMATRRYSEQEVLIINGLNQNSANKNQNVVSSQQSNAQGISIPEFHKALRQREQQTDIVVSSTQRQEQSNSKKHKFSNNTGKEANRNLVGSPIMSKTNQVADRKSEKIQIQKSANKINASVSTQSNTTRTQNHKSSANQSFSSSKQPHALSQAQLTQVPSKQIVHTARQQSSHRQQQIIQEIKTQQSNKKFGAPTSKIDLIGIENEWRDILRFLDQWNIPIKSKNAYTKSEMMEFIKHVENKFHELDKVTIYERRKAEEYKEEAKLLNDQIEQIKLQYIDRNAMINDIKKEFTKHQLMIIKMEECQQELKQTLLNSLMCLDFYKDLENYIQENKYENQSKDVIMHFDVIEELVQQHGLYSLDFDTERIQKLIDSIQDYIRVKEIEKKIIEITLNDEQYNKSEDDDDYEREGLKIKVTRLKPHVKKGSMGLIGDNRSQSQTRGQTARNSNKCTCNSFSIYKRSIQEDMKNKNAQITRLREQLEHKIKKVLQLKGELKLEREEDSKKRRQRIYHESIVKLEKDYNLQVIRNTKMQLEIKELKEENESLRISLTKQKDLIKEQQNDLVELRKVLNSKEGFQFLETAVSDVTNLLLSKKNEQLNTSQKQQLRAIFGNSAILHKLRQRIQSGEDHITKLTEMLTNSIKLNMQFQDTIEDQWCLLKQVYHNFREVSEDELQQYQLIILHQLLRDKWTDESIDQYEREFAQKLVTLKEIRSEISRESVLEQMSRNMAEDKDKITLLSMAVDNKQNRRKICQSQSSQQIGTFLSNVTPKCTRQGMISFENMKSVNNPPATVQKQVLTRIQSDTKIQGNEGEDLLGDITMDRFDEFKEMFEDKLEEDLNLRFSDKQPQQHQQKQRIPDPSEKPPRIVQRKASCISQVRDVQKNIFGQVDDDEQLSSINRIMDVTSLSRIGGVKITKKQLRDKLRNLRQANQQLTATLMTMQERAAQTQKQNINTHVFATAQEGDLSSIQNQTMNQTEEGRPTACFNVDQRDLVSIIHLQAEDLESRLFND